jgi:D-sedoheptulose 7-phosphate isomerase
MSPLETLLDHYPQLAPCAPQIEAAFDLLNHCYATGGKLLLCGNGGSASDADHIAGELLKGFKSRRPLPPDLRASLGDALADRLEGALPAIPLGNFTALNTAYLNDVDGDYTFAQLVLGLGKPGDVLLGISTSGNAKNVNHAFRAARALGLKTLGLTGEDGGAFRENCDVCVFAPSTETYRIQELHLPIYHALCLMIEAEFFPPEAPV